MPGEYYRQKSLVGCSPWSRKELDTTEAAEHTQNPIKNKKLKKKKNQSFPNGRTNEAQ